MRWMKASEPTQEAPPTPEPIPPLHPDPDTPDTRESSAAAWRTLGALFFAGGTIGTISLLLPHPASFNDGALWSNIAIAYAASALCLVLATRRLPPWTLQVVVAAGILAITRAVYYSAEASGFYTFLYVWVGLYAFFFLERRWAIVQVAITGAAYAWVITQIPHSAAVARWLITIGTMVVGGMMLDTLLQRVRGEAQRSALVARERAALLVKLEEVARTDDLTGLPNRRAWNEELAREVARAGREDIPLCVGVIDLDRFKRYNDQHGHQAGDRLLKAISAVWRQRLRTTDALARYGGEEFALALPGCDIEDGKALVERLREAVPDDQTCSVGLACWDNEEPATSLFERADVALYEAKKAGRDRISTA
jgi:diguanylate cyclase (GGDEF)-like protein